MHKLHLRQQRNAPHAFKTIKIAYKPRWSPTKYLVLPAVCTPPYFTKYLQQWQWQVQSLHGKDRMPQRLHPSPMTWLQLRLDSHTQRNLILQSSGVGVQDIPPLPALYLVSLAPAMWTNKLLVAQIQAKMEELPITVTVCCQCRSLLRPVVCCQDYWDPTQSPPKQQLWTDFLLEHPQQEENQHHLL